MVFGAWAARAVAAVALTAAAWPAQAAWVRVETDKFIVYGRGGERAVAAYATKLNTYDAVLRRFHPSTLERKPNTKVQVFMVGQRDELRHVRPGLNRMIAGFYSATNEGVYAMALRDGGLGEDDVMFHEYAHHFMLENFPAAYPAWFVEGWAEYFMTTEIKPDVIKVGGYNVGRVYGIFGETWIPLEDLLSKTSFQLREQKRDVYYSLSWLLMHYMRSDDARAHQLDAAIKDIAQGKDPVKSLEAATGQSIAELTKSLRKYQKLQILGLKNPGIPVPMTVAELPKSADDLLLDNLRLILSQTGAVDADFLASVRRKAARHPGDAFAEQVLARAEFVMGDVAAGEAIMTRRLAASPTSYEDLLLAGTGQLIAGIRDPKAREARFRAARPIFAKTYAQNKTDFRPIYAYALARSIEPGFPTDNDMNALMEARHLAPAVQELSWRAGMALIQKGRREEAERVLAPVINNPHAGRAADRARELLKSGRVAASDLEEPEDDEERPPPSPSAPPQPGPAKPAT
jgi:hypothetical protein